MKTLFFATSDKKFSTIFTVETGSNIAKSVSIEIRSNRHKYILHSQYYVSYEMLKAANEVDAIKSLIHNQVMDAIKDKYNSEDVYRLTDYDIRPISSIDDSEFNEAVEALFGNANSEETEKYKKYYHEEEEYEDKDDNITEHVDALMVEDPTGKEDLKMVLMEATVTFVDDKVLVKGKRGITFRDDDRAMLRNVETEETEIHLKSFHKICSQLPKEDYLDLVAGFENIFDEEALEEGLNYAYYDPEKEGHILIKGGEGYMKYIDKLMK